MSPRDKALAELLDELAAYLFPPQAADPAGDRAAQDTQRERAIQAQVLLRSMAVTLRDPKSQSQILSPAELFAGKLDLIREYAAKPLRYEPYEPQS